MLCSKRHNAHAEYLLKRQNVQLIASKQMQASIEKWLSSPDPSTNYNKALQQRQKGTGVWSANSSPFQRWQTQQHSFLWLHGFFFFFFFLKKIIYIALSIASINTMMLMQPAGL
jgi:hypothetical protein